MVYLGSVEVSGPGSESVVRETVEQLKTLGLSTMNIVTFKASMNGITLTDDINGYGKLIWGRHPFRIYHTFLQHKSNMPALCIHMFNILAALSFYSQL